MPNISEGQGCQIVPNKALPALLLNKYILLDFIYPKMKSDISSYRSTENLVCRDSFPFLFFFKETSTWSDCKWFQPEPSNPSPEPLDLPSLDWVSSPNWISHPLYGLISWVVSFP